GHCNYGTGGIWDLYPLDERALKERLNDANRAGGKLEINKGTPGVGSIGFEPASSMIGVALYLSMLEFEKGGLSTFEEWARILRSNVDDEQKDVLLQLKFDS